MHQEDSEDRSRSRSTTQSTHSIEQSFFQDHPELHERLPNDLHEILSCKDSDESTNYVKKTFHAISRSKSVASISSETDPDGKTKILTILKIKLPHQHVIDNVSVKVNNGAEANILPLDSFRTMFPHALDDHGYPKDGFLRRSRTKLECYDDRKLINHGSIKLRLQHYSDESFQDHSFYVVETRTHKDIIVRHAANSRLGLIQVICKNVSKSVSAIENKTNTSSRDSFQDPCLKIDGKMSQRNQRVASKSFQDHPPGSFKTMATCTCTETPFKTPANTQGRRKQLKSTPFRTLDVDGIRVIRETPFKTQANT